MQLNLKTHGAGLKGSDRGDTQGLAHCIVLWVKQMSIEHVLGGFAQVTVQSNLIQYNPIQSKPGLEALDGVECGRNEPTV